jgi:hypothetical protein
MRRLLAGFLHCAHRLEIYDYIGNVDADPDAVEFRVAMHSSKRPSSSERHLPKVHQRVQI